MKNAVRQAITTLGVWLWAGTFLVIMFFVVAWVCTSFVITSYGPVRWREGFEKMLEYYFS